MMTTRRSAAMKNINDGQKIDKAKEQINKDDEDIKETEDETDEKEGDKEEVKEEENQLEKIDIENDEIATTVNAEEDDNKENPENALKVKDSDEAKEPENANEATTTTTTATTATTASTTTITPTTTDSDSKEDLPNDDAEKTKESAIKDNPFIANTKENKIDDVDDDNKDNEELLHESFDKHEEGELHIDHEEDVENDPEFMEIFRSKIKLDDGTEEYLFSSGVRYSRLTVTGVYFSKSYFPINCHLCKASRIKTKSDLIAHTNDEKHLELVNGPSPNAAQYRKPFIQIFSPRHRPIKIYPGEIINQITPEYFDRVIQVQEFEFKPNPPAKLVSELQNDPIHDYNQNAPVIGLSYAFKMKDKNTRQVHYFCGLCKKVLINESSGYQHFVGSNHQKEYSLRHFKHLHIKLHEKMEALDTKLSEPLKKQAIRNILRVLYRKIEMVFGLRKACIMDVDDFRRNQSKIVRSISAPFCQYHYDENSIVFDDAEIQELIDKSIKNEKIIENDPVSIPTNKKKVKAVKGSDGGDGGGGSGVVTGARGAKNAFGGGNNTQETNTRRPIPGVSANLSQIAKFSLLLADQFFAQRGNNPAVKPPQAPILSKTRRSRNRGNSANNKGDVASVYKVMMENVVCEINEQYKKYDMYPETHPKYDVEWKKFWARRSMELKRDYINPERYNFKPEWENCWKGLMKTFYHNELARRKNDVKRKLNISLRDPSPISSQSFINRGRIQEQQQQPQKRKRTPSPPLYSGKMEGGEGNQQRRMRRESPSLRDAQFMNERNQFRSQPLPSLSGAERSNTDNTPLTVVSILRLLTALEDELGSLGPKAIELLGQAVIFEKEKNESSNKLLNNQEYYMLLMTSMEKLKGKIFADIIPPFRVRAVNKAVNDLETLIQQFDNYARRNNLLFGGHTNVTPPPPRFNQSLSASPKIQQYRAQQNSFGGGGGGDNNRESHDQDNIPKISLIDDDDSDEYHHPTVFSPYYGENDDRRRSNQNQYGRERELKNEYFSGGSSGGMQQQQYGSNDLRFINNGPIKVEKMTPRKPLSSPRNDNGRGGSGGNSSNANEMWYKESRGKDHYSLPSTSSSSMGFHNSSNNNLNASSTRLEPLLSSNYYGKSNQAVKNESDHHSLYAPSAPRFKY